MLLFVVSSCKKTDKSEQFAEKNQLSVSELRLLYNTELGLTQKPNAGQIEVRDGINWKKAVSLKKLNGSNLLSIPILTTQTDLSNGAQRRLVANRDSDNKVDIAVVVVIPNKEYLIAKKGKLSIKDFTGYMLFLEIDNKFRNGYILENGKIIGEAKLEQNNVIEKQLNNAKVALRQNTTNNTPNKVQYLITECEWRQGGSYVDSDGVLNIVSIRYCKTTSLPNQPTPFELEPIPEGEGGSGGIWEAYDCNNVQNGEAYTNPDCNTCMGGNTGITACNNNIEVKTDSLKAKFPCASKLLNTLIADTAFVKFIKPFLMIGSRPDIIWVTKPTLLWNVGGTTQYGSAQNGITYPDGFYSGTSSIVSLNTNMLTYSSKRLIASVMIHETIHSYLNYIHSWHYQYSEVTDADKPILERLNNYAKIASSTEGVHHLTIIENFINVMAGIISRVDNNANTEQDYYKIILGTLGEDGKTPSANFQNEFDTLLDNINSHKLFSITKNNASNMVEANRDMPQTQRLNNNCN